MQQIALLHATVCVVCMQQIALFACINRLHCCMQHIALFACMHAGPTLDMLTRYLMLFFNQLGEDSGLGFRIRVRD